MKVYNVEMQNQGVKLAKISFSANINCMVEFNDVQVLQKGDSMWISFPSRGYDVNGERKYKELTSLQPFDKRSLQEQVLAEFVKCMPKEEEIPF